MAGDAEVWDLGASVHRLIAGPTGSGKSFFSGYLIEKLHDAGRPYIVLDTKSKNHIGLVGLPGAARVVIRPGCRYDWRGLVDHRAVIVVPSPRLALQELIGHYTDLLDALYTAGAERTILIEEAHNYSKNAYSPAPILELITREGRGRRISLWFCTQRIQDFSKLLWSQCYYTYLLKFLIPQDIRYCEALIPDFSRINRELGRWDVLQYNHITGDHSIALSKSINRRLTRHYG